MSGVNNVALWTGKQASPYVPFVNIAPIVGGTNGISPIFLTTVDVTGGIGIDLKNWVKKVDENGNPVLNENGEPFLEQAYSVATGTVLTINTKRKKYITEIRNLLIFQNLSLLKNGIHQSWRILRIVFGKKLQTFAAQTLGIEAPVVFAPSKKFLTKDKVLQLLKKSSTEMQ
jgi:aconitate hydratase 2/2-methylisocitrate dehydratase